MRRLLLSLLLVGALFVPFGVAQAKDGIPVQVTYTACENITSARTAGPNTLATGSAAEVWTGTFSGSYVATESDVIYADGSVRFQGNGTFTGLVDGRFGSFVYTYEGFAPTSGPFSGHWVASRGSEGLAGLQAQGEFVGVTERPTPGCDIPYSGTFSGEMRFKP